MHQTDQLAAMVMFAKIVETHSYTDAARELGLSKSLLSKEIVKLETALGVSLLRRTTRRLEVSEIGHAYYRYCARVLHELKGAEALLQQFHEEPVGNLRLSAPVTFGNRMVVPALCAFMREHVHLQVDLELTDRVVDLQQEDLDLAIVISREPPEPLLSLALMAVEWGLYAAPDYLAAQPPVLTPQDLNRHGFLSFGGRAHLPTLTLRKGKQQVELKLRCLLRSNNSVSLLQAARLGNGIAYLPHYVASDALADGSLCALLPDWGSEVRMAYASFQERRFLSPRVRLFVEALQRHFATAAQWTLLNKS
jgi:DNA-binding transcriptional LysR family regulator